MMRMSFLHHWKFIFVLEFLAEVRISNINEYYQLSHSLGIPGSDTKNFQNKIFGLETNSEELNAIDFKKGCYVGQEVTARMKHKTELHKGLVKIGSEETMVVGEELFLNDKPIGSVLTVYDRSALAYVRLKNRDEILSTKSTKRIFVDTNPISSN